MTEYKEWGGMEKIRFLDKSQVTLTDSEGKEINVPDGHVVTLDRNGNMDFVPLSDNEIEEQTPQDEKEERLKWIKKKEEHYDL